MSVCWYHNQQRLCWCNHPANGMDGQLLHDTINWRGEGLIFGSPVGLDQILAQTRCLAFRLDVQAG